MSDLSKRRAEADQALAAELIADTARTQIERTKARAADPQDAGRSLPLPMGDAGSVTIGEALRAAVFQLDELERQLGRRSAHGRHEPDSHEGTMTIPAHIADAVRRDR